MQLKEHQSELSWEKNRKSCEEIKKANIKKWCD